MIKIFTGARNRTVAPWRRISLSTFISDRLVSHPKRTFSRTAKVNKDAAASAKVTNVAVSTKPPSTLVELAATITHETQKLDTYMSLHNLPQPSLTTTTPPSFPALSAPAARSRQLIIRALKDLLELVTGPTESLRQLAWQHNNALSLHAIYHYRMAHAVPVDGEATFGEIAERVGLDEINVARLMRHAMGNRIFREVREGVVAHSAKSRVLREDGGMDDWVGFCVEDIWPAAAQTIAALKLNPSASSPTQTGFCLANNTTDIEPMFATFGQSPFRAKRMGGAMASLTGGEGYELAHLLHNYAWAPLDAKGGTVVDIGGSHGHACIALAKEYPNLRFVVQDLEKTVASVPQVPVGLEDRIKFMAHDFNTPQPVRGADVYFYRWIMHNYADEYAVHILRQLIPALKRGARVLINEYCMRAPGRESPGDEEVMRTMDLVMLTLLNSQERDEEGFRRLFGMVDGRFRFVGVRRVEGCRMSVVEAVWEGEDYGEVERVET